MMVPPRYRLSDADTDTLLFEQVVLIERLAARVAQLEALVGKRRPGLKDSTLAAYVAKAGRPRWPSGRA